MKKYEAPEATIMWGGGRIPTPISMCKNWADDSDSCYADVMI